MRMDLMDMGSLSTTPFQNPQDRLGDVQNRAENRREAFEESCSHKQVKKQHGGTRVLDNKGGRYAYFSTDLQSLIVGWNWHKEAPKL